MGPLGRPLNEKVRLLKTIAKDPTNILFALKTMVTMPTLVDGSVILVLLVCEIRSVQSKARRESIL